MCVSVDIVGVIGTDCWRYIESVIFIKFAGVKFRNAKEEFIRSSTLVEGHIICKCDSGGLVLEI